MGLLSSLVFNASSHTKFVSLGKQKCQIQPIFINLHPNEYIQEFPNYQFIVKSNKCVESQNTLNDLSNKVYFANKTEDLNLSVFNIII